MKKKPIILKDTVMTPYSDMSTSFKDAVAGVSQQLASSGTKSVVLSGVEPQVGVTTLAACLAEQEALYKRVLLIDCNIRAPRIGDRYSVTGDGITNYSISKMVHSSFIHKISDNLDVVAVGTVAEKSSVFLLSGAFKAKFDEIAVGYDMVIVDCADIENYDDALRIASAAGKILLVVGSHSRKKKMAHAFHKCNAGKLEIAGVVINSFNSLQDNK